MHLMVHKLWYVSSFCLTALRRVGDYLLFHEIFFDNVVRHRTLKDIVQKWAWLRCHGAVMECSAYDVM
jgi:hypothetical protein